MSKQLQQLAEPFRSNLIGKKPGQSGGAYVGHSVVTERALEVLGPYSITSVQLIRGYAPEIKGKQRTFPAIPDAVTGAIVTIEAEIDTRKVILTEVGDCENPAMHETDGARAKNAVSDAIKRCWMRAGIGLHLWSRDQYGLDDALSEPTPPPSNAWKEWEDRNQALRYSMELFDADGVHLFNAGQHAANSYDKLTRAYVDSLPPEERPNADSSDKEKDTHRTAVHKLWNEKLIAKWHGHEYADPEPWIEHTPLAEANGKDKPTGVTV